MNDMTEESYQQCRKVMQKINYKRGQITTAKGHVAKWTKIESTFRTNLQESRADGAKKMLDIYLKKLNEFRQQFAAIKFPDSDIVMPKPPATTQCEKCGDVILAGSDYCDECYSILIT